MTHITKRILSTTAVLTCLLASTMALMILPGMAMAHEGEPLPPISTETTPVQTPEVAETTTDSDSSLPIIPIGIGVSAVLGIGSFIWLRRGK
jgi:hypothetical protein